MALERKASQVSANRSPSPGLWHPSHGVRFRSSTILRTWTPSNGIVFAKPVSPRNQERRRARDSSPGSIHRFFSSTTCILLERNNGLFELEELHTLELQDSPQIRQAAVCTNPEVASHALDKQSSLAKAKYGAVPQSSVAQSPGHRSAQGWLQLLPPEPSIASHIASLPVRSRLPRTESTFNASQLKKLGAERASTEDASELMSTVSEAESSGTLPRDYRISQDLLREALMSSSNTGAAHWHYRLYRNENGIPPRVFYCTTKESTEEVMDKFLEKDILGFDVEWLSQASTKDGIKRNVSLLQIASDDSIALIHFAVFPGQDLISDLLTPKLQKLLESSTIKKVGVAIRGDCTRINHYLGVKIRGSFELTHLHKVVKFGAGEISTVNKSLVSLAAQVLEHLKLPLFKGRVRCSNWTKKLTKEQIDYAAGDAYAGLQVYYVLEERRLALVPSPPRPEDAELDMPLRVVDDTIEDDETSKDDDAINYDDMIKDELDGGDIDDSASLRGKPSPVVAAIPLGATELQLAKRWVRVVRPRGGVNVLNTVPPRMLLEYHIWHFQSFSILEVSTLVRKPSSVVASDIASAIRIGQLPCATARLQDVFDHLPEGGKESYKEWVAHLDP